MLLLIKILAVLSLMIFVTIRFKVHPLYSLVGAALAIGLLVGFDTSKTIELLLAGFGNTLGAIGLIIAFGTTIGVFLEKNGGTKVIAERILQKIPLSRSPLAMNFIGFIVSIPVYCDSGFVILSPINKALSKKSGIALVVFAVSLSTGLYATHVFVPPTPGPLAAAAMLGADIGLVMLLGLAVAVPVSFVGYLWATFIGKRIGTAVAGDVAGEQPENLDRSTSSPGGKGLAEREPQKANLLPVLLPLLVPIFLIALKSIAEFPSLPFGDGLLSKAFRFVGNPMMALLVGVLLVFWNTRTKSRETRYGWVETSLREAGLILLVTGAGGAFGNVLRATDLAGLIAPGNATASGGLLLAFGLAALLKTAQGSSTVSIITTAAIMAPVLVNFGLDGAMDTALTVLAIGSGALTVSHINDSYFWVVSQFSDMDLKTALKGHTVGTFFQGVTGIVLVLVLHLVF